jgi:glycosyltransferase involved in cell wall biosynthesis
VQFKVAGPVRDYLSPEYGPAVLKDWETLDNLEYLGPLAPAEAIAFVGRSRLFLSTSPVEGLPNTMLEAWSGKVPVVALGVDPGDIITTHRTGVITADVEDAVRTLSALMSDPERTSQLGMNGWQYVADHHSADYVSRQIEAAFGLRARAEQEQS